MPVLVERSSYESHPLGRMEWIKLYAALLGKEAEAADYFGGLMERLTPILEQENTGKTQGPSAWPEASTPSRT